MTHQGFQPDPEKVQAVRSMPTPGTKEDVRRFLGFVKYLPKFIPNLSTVDAPLRDVMKKRCRFPMGQSRTEKLPQAEGTLLQYASVSVLRFDEIVTIHGGARSYGLGGVLL